MESPEEIPGFDFQDLIRDREEPRMNFSAFGRQNQSFNRQLAA